jgi:hypothetical protein
MEREPIKPIEISLGNIIEVMGKVELVTGVVQESKGEFRMGHTGWNAGNGFMPDGITFSTFPIPLTMAWKVCLGIEKYDLPEWIEYVHQAQNYFLWALRVNLLEIMDWDLLPKTELTN